MYIKDKAKKVRELSGYEDLGDTDYVKEAGKALQSAATGSGVTVEDVAALRGFNSKLKSYGDAAYVSAYKQLATQVEAKTSVDISNLYQKYGVTIGEALKGSLMPSEVVGGMALAVKDYKSNFVSIAKSLGGGLTADLVQGAFEFDYTTLRSQASLVQTMIDRAPSAITFLANQVSGTSKTAASVVDAAGSVATIAVDAYKLSQSIEAKGGVDSSGIAAIGGLLQRTVAVARNLAIALGASEEDTDIMGAVSAWIGAAAGCGTAIAAGAAGAGYGAIAGAVACLGMVIAAAFQTAMIKSKNQTLQAGDGPWVANMLSPQGAPDALIKSRLGLAAADSTRLSIILKSRYGIPSYESMIGRVKWYPWLWNKADNPADEGSSWATSGSAKDRQKPIPGHTPYTILSMLTMCPPTYRPLDGSWSGIESQVLNELASMNTAWKYHTLEMPFNWVLWDIETATSWTKQCSGYTVSPRSSGLRCDNGWWLTSKWKISGASKIEECVIRMLERFEYHEMNVATIRAVASVAKKMGSTLYSGSREVHCHNSFATDELSEKDRWLPTAYWAAFLHLEELIDYFAAMTKLELETSEGQKLLEAYLKSTLPVSFRVVTNPRTGGDTRPVALQLSAGPLTDKSDISSEWYAEDCWTNLPRCGISCDLQSLYKAMIGQGPTGSAEEKECALREFGWIRILAAFSYMHVCYMDGEADDTKTKYEMFKGVDSIVDAPILDPSRRPADLANLPVDPRPSLATPTDSTPYGLWVTPGIDTLIQKIRLRNSLEVETKKLAKTVALAHDRAFEDAVAAAAKLKRHILASALPIATRKYVTGAEMSSGIFGKRATAQAWCKSQGAGRYLVGFLPVDWVDWGGYSGYEGFGANSQLVLDTKASAVITAIAAGKTPLDSKTLEIDWKKVDLTQEPWKSIDWKSLHVGCCPSPTRAGNVASCGANGCSDAGCTSKDSYMVPEDVLIKAVDQQGSPVLLAAASAGLLILAAKYLL